MTAAELLGELKARDVILVAEGGRLRFYPASRVPEPLVEELRRRKAEVMELVWLEGWPEASREAVRRFGDPVARLYPFLNRPVVTPAGRGVLLQVFSERVTVALNSEPGRASFWLPSEVYPPELKAQARTLREAAN